MCEPRQSEPCLRARGRAGDAVRGWRRKNRAEALRAPLANPVGPRVAHDEAADVAAVVAVAVGVPDDVDRVAALEHHRPLRRREHAPLALHRDHRPRDQGAALLAAVPRDVAAVVGVGRARDAGLGRRRAPRRGGARHAEAVLRHREPERQRAPPLVQRALDIVNVVERLERFGGEAQRVARRRRREAVALELVRVGVGVVRADGVGQRAVLGAQLAQVVEQVLVGAVLALDRRAPRHRAAVDDVGRAVRVGVGGAGVREVDAHRLPAEAHERARVDPPARRAVPPVRVLEDARHREEVAVAAIHLVGRRRQPVEQHLVRQQRRRVGRRRARREHGRSRRRLRFERRELGREPQDGDEEADVGTRKHGERRHEPGATRARRRGDEEGLAQHFSIDM